MKKIKKCLMIETSDNKKFFTNEENYTKLLEFANSFNCEMSTVKLEDGKILDLETLACAISTKDNEQKPKYEILKKKFYKKRKTS